RHGLYVTIVCYVLLAIVVDRGTRSVPLFVVLERDRLIVVDRGTRSVPLFVMLSMTVSTWFGVTPLCYDDIHDVTPRVSALAGCDMFAATTPGNTPFAYRASTSTDPTPMISPAFIEANYEILESLLRDRRRQIHNEDLRTEVEYFSEDYDEEREMKLRPERTSWSRGKQKAEDKPPPTFGNPLGKKRIWPTSATSLTSIHGCRQSSINIGGNIPPNDPTGSVTPFVRWIEDYPLPDRLKIPYHVGSYNGNGDPDNFLHLFEGAIRMQKWLMPVACSKRGSRRRTWQFTSSNKEKARVSELSPLDLPSTYKGLMEKTYTWIEAREVATNGAPNDQRDNFKRSRKSSWDNGRGQKSRDRFSPYRGPNHGLLSSLSKSPREILATEKVARSFEQPPRMLGSRRSRDMSKYCYFHKDHGHDTNDCQLSHL
ncbi:hypothetical protein Tco_1024505, partial [Tanacetum coccineum]